MQNKNILTSLVWLLAFAIVAQAATTVRPANTGAPKVTTAKHDPKNATASKSLGTTLPPKEKSVEREGFKLLGSLSQPKTVTKFGQTSTVFETFYYWESVNSAGRAEAARDCRANGDTLLYMETREEVENVTRWLQNTDTTGTLYWVGGRYDMRSDSFTWDNGVPFGPHAPWVDGEPIHKKGNTGVAAQTINGEIRLRTQANTFASRYICESERPDDGDSSQLPQPCYKDNDLVIVVDSSGSVSISHYEVAKEFTSRLATTWVDHSGSRVAVQVYSSYAMPIFGLKDVQTVPEIKTKVYNMPYIGGGTASDLAIALATDELQNNTRGVVRNMVFLTDGHSNSRSSTKAAADMANSLGIRTFSVGVGSGVDDSELLAIAGGHLDRKFHPSQFDELLSVLRPVSKKVCN